MIEVNDKNLGHATAYAYAVSKGYEGTEEEFAELMASYATVAVAAEASAKEAEGFAVGEEDGTPVQEGSPYYQNNAKYYNDEAGQSAQAAADSAGSSETDALKSEGFAVGKQNGTPVQEDSPYYHNNAEYFSDNADSSAQAASNSAGAANTDALKSEGFAVGQQNGADVTDQSPYYHNSAKYYKEQAAASAGSILGLTAEGTVDANVGTPQVNIEVSDVDNHKKMTFTFMNMKGEPGVSVVVTVTDILGGHRVTLTDYQGDHTFDVMDGEVTMATLQQILEDYARINGYYEDLTAGNAEQLISSVSISDNAPYNFRTSGGSVDIGDREMDKLIGGTVAWNQLWDETMIPSDSAIKSVSTYTENNVTFTKNGDGSITIQTTAEGASANTHVKIADSATIGQLSFRNLICGAYGGSGSTYCIQHSNSNTYDAKFRDGLAIGFNMWVHVYSGAIITTPVKIYPQIFNLDQMFGTTISSYLLTLGDVDGFAWFRKLFPKLVYPRNTGELMSVQTSAHVMRGFNQWDEEWEYGGIDNSTGQNNNNSSTDRIRSKNYIPVVGGQTYCFSRPVGSFYTYWYDGNKNFIEYKFITTANQYATVTADSRACYCRFYVYYATPYANNLCVSLYWDGERAGEYEPYKLESYPLDSDLELRGIPKLDANNELYYDGDTYESNGTVTRRYGIVDLGTLDWSYNGTAYANPIFYALVTGKENARYNEGRTTKYVFVTTNVNGLDNAGNALTSDKLMVLSNGTQNPAVYIRDDSYSDAATFKTAMDGVYLVYELATSATEEADPYTNPQIVSDWGTEEYVDTRDIQIPVGHETQYQANLKAKLEMAPNSPSDGDGLYGVRQTSGLNSYEKIVFPTELPSNPSSDGTYYLKSSVSEGTPVLTWSDDIPFEFANIYNLIGQLHNDNPTWNDVQALVRSGHAREAFPIGTVFEVTRTGQDTLYKVVADYDNPNYTLSASGHNMILMDVYAIYTKQFDARQALLYFPEAVEGNVTMNFLVKGAYYSDDNNKYIQFTSPADGITAGSQLVLSNAYNATMIGTNAKLYTGFLDTTGVNVALSQGNSGTYIGQTDGTAAGTIELNRIHRAVLGSNNYGESAIDQWINSDAAANAWQTQRTHFQRPATYANLAGYMNGMDPDFLNVLAETDVICRSNNVFELDGELNKLYIITNRKFFLASRVELGYGAENNLYEGRVFELYATATDANKIKYDISNKTTARSWWLRSPYPADASNARYVRTSGSLYGNYAINGDGAVSACVIC